MFISRLGTTSLAISVMGLSACSDDGSTAAETSAAPPTTTSTTQGIVTSTSLAATPGTTTPLGASYERINLGNVSAYLIVRSGEIGIIDTGNPGSEGAIGDAVSALGLSWSNVGHIGVTHAHGDHAGSLAAVADLATSATLYAANPDLRSMSAPRSITEVSDGSAMFGLAVVATPGHTEGHICFHDPAAGLLFAGDALNGSNGGVTGANPQYTPDIAEADNSVRKLARLSFETILFGHGEPVLALGDQQVATLADSL